MSTERDDVLKSYDSALMGRLLRYVKPYALIAIGAVVAVLLATAGEMTIPVLLKIGVDRFILPNARRVDMHRLDGPLAETVAEAKDAIVLVDAIFVSPDGLKNLTRAQKQDLIAEGILSEENYLVLNITEGNRDLIATRPDLFTEYDGLAVVATDRLGALSLSERATLREEHIRGVARLAGILLAVLLVVFGSAFASVYLMAYVGQRVLKDLRTELFDHTIRLSMRFLTRNPVGRLVTRITNDVETINELFANVITSFLKDFSLMIGVYLTLFLLNPRLAFVTLFTLPPLFVAAVIYRGRVREAFRWVRRSVSAVNAFLSEHISGMAVVQLFAREKVTLAEFEDRNTELKNANFREVYVFGTFRPLVDVLATISIGVIVYFGARFFLAGMVSLGVVIAFTNLIRRFFEPVLDLSEKYNILQSAMAGAERVFGLLDETDMIAQPSRVVAPRSNGGAVEFDHVSFHYKEGEPVLTDLSFRVEAGETVAVVGYTGAGKTTITSVLSRLYDVQGGRILLDGQDIRDLPTDSLRTRVQSVLQDVFVFTGTVEENIRLGAAIDMDAVEEAARLVRADVFIRELPEGYNSLLTERGANLSTGQRQLLSFARVIAHNPDVLLLDEATANIDGETERLIQDALDTLLADRTSLVIAHRLSTIRNADRILVLDHGRLVEDGTHAGLLARGGLYSTLYRMQYSRDGLS